MEQAGGHFGLHGRGLKLDIARPQAAFQERQADFRCRRAPP
jgi:hypothetical protein